MFRRIALTALFIIGSALSASAASTSASESPRAPTAAPGSYQVAQACGWYAISVCSRRFGGAQRGANRYGGYVINSSSAAYPNFRPGWFCSVRGPTSRGQARRFRNVMRSLGARTAYVKNAC